MGNFFSSFNILSFFYSKKANGLMLGLDGAGKTTTFYMITGMITPYFGKIYLMTHYLKRIIKIKLKLIKKKLT